MPITYYVAVPFGRDDEGNLVPLEPIECQSSESARGRARSAAALHVGAVAFSRTGDPVSGEFEEATIIEQYGEIDPGLLAH